MSIFVTSLAWKFSKATGSTLLVLLAISDFADDDGRAFPAVGTLAAKARISDRTVQYAIAELKKLGELIVEEGSSRYDTNVFYVQIARLSRGANSAPLGNEGCNLEQSGVKRVAPESSEEQSVEGGAPYPREAETKLKAKRKPDPIRFDDARGVFAGVSGEQIAMWRTAYPQIDVEAEIVRAACWCIANPERVPHKRAGRFLNGWLGRARPMAQLSAQQPRHLNRFERAQYAADVLTGRNRKEPPDAAYIDV